jgi:mono/diheme cytochrome c family protein
MMRFLAAIGFLTIVAMIAIAAFFFGGFFNVAATAKDPDFVNWALVRFRQASIARHADEKPPLSLDDAKIVRDGARAYAERGCVHCHGAPGVEWSKFSEGLNPDPPDLKDVAAERDPRDLFWTIKNGIKMTGMPGFATVGVPDPEIWSITAFLKKLPTIKPEDYKSWSAPPVVTPVR